MTVQTIVTGDIARVIIDNPPVNAISAAVRQGLLGAVAELDRTDGLRAVILSCAGRTFIAGADVSEFDKPAIEPHLPDVIAAIEGARLPWCALIHGSALGGGLEIALGCRFRLALPGASMGLPEVTLGIIPGAGGTVRLPRLVGLADAVALITSGKPVKAEKALSLGLIDEIVADEAAAVAFLEEALTRPLPQPVSARAVAPQSDDFWTTARKDVTRAAKGNTGPVEALESIRAASELDLTAAFAQERERFLRLRTSAQAAALRAIFFAERAAARPAELKGIEGPTFARAGVIGGGTMGAGIAVALREAGLTVTMIERDAEAVARGRANVERIYAGNLAKGRITESQRDARLAGFDASADYAALADCDLVIEAVFEDLDVKRAVFAQLDAVCRPDAVLATNTSYLDPRLIAFGLSHPERFLGLHFFSPANIMKLLEIVPTPDTSPETLAGAFALARAMGKMPVRAGICDGFIGNRLLKQTRTQAERLLLAGCTPSQVDQALRSFGMAMGPFETQDLAGLDIGAFQRQAARARGESPFAPVADRLVAMGRLGRKTEAGWHDYTAKGPSPLLPQAVMDAITEARIELKVERRALTEAQVLDAVMLPMINECATILAEGIALRASDIDLVKVHGYGFPRFRGGPVQYGRSIGFDRVVAGLDELAAMGLAEPAGPALRAWALDTARAA